MVSGLVFHGSRLVFMVFSRFFLWFFMVFAKKKFNVYPSLNSSSRHRMFEHLIGLKQLLAVAQIFMFSRTPSHTSNKSIKLTYTSTGKIEKIEDILVVFAELIYFFCQNHPAVELKIQKGEDGVAWVNTGSRI